MSIKFFIYVVMRKILFILAMIGFGVLIINAQNALVDQDDSQFWNDVQLTVPISKQFDFYTAVALRLGKNITRLNDGRYAVGFI